MAKTEYVKNFAGQTLAIYEIEANGYIAVRDFLSRQIPGYYRAARNVTTDFYGRILFHGNMVGALVKVK